MEQKYQLGNEYGNIMWNIGDMLLDISSFQKKKFSVDKLSENNPFHGNEDYALQTDLSLPCVVVNLSNKFDKLIDGNHRLFKAKKEGLKEIECYYLQEEEHIKFIENFDLQIYRNVINHWTE